MPSELDIELRTRVAAAIAPDAPFATTTLARFGVDLPVFATAPASLPEYFERYCSRHGDAEFLIDGDVRLSFVETYAAGQACARALVGVGAKPGDRIGLAARNSAAWVVGFMGIAMAGGVATLLNGWWTGEELLHCVQLAECAMVLADADRAARLAGPLAEACPATRLVVFDHGHPARAFAGLGVAGDDAVLPALAVDDLATMLFTSGSTGSPKGAVSDQRAVVQAALSYVLAGQVGLGAGVARGDANPACHTILVCLPLFHVTGLVTVLLASLPIARRMVFLPKWDAREAMRLIAAERVTYFIGVPQMSFEIATHPERAQFDLTSCSYFGAGGAPRPPAQVPVLRAGLPHAFPLLGYGLTETNAVGATNFRDNYLARPESTGLPSLPVMEITIRDAAGNDLPTGQVGEICLRSVCNMRGYWRNEAATAAAITPDGFFRSGDLGVLDADGYLTITGRAKDVIIRGGENIAAQEVEAALAAHPGVGEVAVFGRPDARYGEVPVAAWAPADPVAAPDDEVLRGFLANHLAAYKIPAEFIRLPALPRLGTEKFDKQALRARYAAPPEAT